MLRRRTRHSRALVAALLLAPAIVAAGPSLAPSPATAATTAAATPTTEANTAAARAVATGGRVTLVGDDAFVVEDAPPSGRTFTPRALGGPGAGFESFASVVSYTQPAYTIRVVDSPNIGRYMPSIRAAAAALTKHIGRSVTVDPALIAARAAGPGEVIVRTSFTSPCGTFSGGPRTSGSIGCGGPLTNGIGGHYGGEAYLQPDFYCNNRGVELVLHEIGHAFGLTHYNDPFEGLNQVMRSGVSGVPSYRRGDRKGFAAIAGLPEPLTDEFDADIDTPAGSDASAAVGVLPSAPAGAAAPSSAGTAPRTSPPNPRAVATGSLFTAAAAPQRILDSRSGVGVAAGPFANGEVRTLTVPATLAGAPFDAVTLNVTVTGAQGGGYLTVWPSGAAQPNTSVVNYEPAHDVANLVMVKVGAGQSVSIFNSGGPVHVLADFVGGYSPTGSSGFVPTAPARLFDTRSSTIANEEGLPLGCGNSVFVTNSITAAGVPANAVADVVNVTAAGTNGAGYVSVLPSAVPFGTPPSTSTLNVIDVDVRPNLAVTPLRSFYVRTSDDLVSHVIVDLFGYFIARAEVPTAAGFVPVDPVRVLDTRSGVGSVSGPGKLAAASTRTVPIALPADVPADKAIAVVINLTVAEPTAAGYVTAFAAGAAQPPTSNVNYSTGQVNPGLAIVTLAPGGISLYTSAQTHLIGDVMGYFVLP